MAGKKKSKNLRKEGVQGRPYPKMFVREAIKLAKRLKSAQAAARELGIHPNTLLKWMRKESK